MSKVIRIGGICGSLRAASYNKQLLHAAQKLCPPEAVIETIDIKDLPLYNEDNDGPNPPEAVRIFREKVATYDALLLVSPEYNFSVTGVLKNCIDTGSRPYGKGAMVGKVVGIMGAGQGTYPGTSGTARAQYHLRQIGVFMNWMIPNQEVLMTAAQTRFNDKGELTDEFFQKKISSYLKELIRYVEMQRFSLDAQKK